MFHIALRSLCDGDDKRLFLQEPIDPFASTIPLTDTTATFTRQYLDAFRSDVTEETVILQDRLETGWLVWGKEMETSRLSGWDEQAWKIDERCRPGLDLIQSIMQQDGWWQQVSVTMNKLTSARQSLGTRRSAHLSLSQSHRLCARYCPIIRYRGG
jgi:proteasome activator subunit 4